MFSSRTREGLERWMARVRGSGRLVAVFDLDNTILKNDLGDTIFWWLLRNDLLRAQDWRKSSPYLTEEAVQELSCCPVAANGNLITSRGDATELLLSLYHEHCLPGRKESAWSKDHDPELMFPPFAWLCQLMTGHAPDDIRAFTREATAVAFKSTVGAMLQLGARNMKGFLRIHEPVLRLMGWLSENGVEVWVSSASCQYAIDTLSDVLPVPTDRFIGARAHVDQKGRITPTFEGCAGYPAGNCEIMNYRQGKRCWINKVVFNLPDSKSLRDTPSPIHLAAGDSEGDYFILKDATDIKLVVQTPGRPLPVFAAKPLAEPWYIELMPA